MENFALKTNDNKIVRINRSTDPCLFETPCNPPNTGTTYTRGTDLHAHKARSGAWYYYFYHWTMWQGEPSNYKLATEQEAIDFLIDKAGKTGWEELTEKEKERIAEVFGRDIFEETA